MRKNLGELVDSAYEQGLRTKKYILENREPVFEYKNGSEALRIKDKVIIKNIFLLNVTLSNLSPLSSQLPLLKKLELIKGRDWPWSVFINDLRVISELIELPSEFLLFLKRRIRANDFPQFRPFDELDFLMFFFHEGLYFEDGTLEGMDVLTPHAYTEPLDRYYDFLGGRVSSGEKPKLKIDDGFRDFIRDIESTGKFGFSRVTTSLLDMDSKVQRDILQNIIRMQESTKNEGIIHDFSLTLKKLNKGITFITFDDDGKIGKYTAYCLLKKYQNKSNEWIVILIKIEPEGNRKLDFLIIDQKWTHDPEMEIKLQRFKDEKIRQATQQVGKIGRNSNCPCGSGVKYKRCCGK